MHVVVVRGMALARAFVRKLEEGGVEIILKKTVPVKLSSGKYATELTCWIDEADQLYAEYALFAVSEEAPPGVLGLVRQLA